MNKSTTTDTPRTDACPHCGAEESRIKFSLRTLQTLVMSLTDRAEKAEAKVERLKKMVIEAAELGDKRSENFKARAEKAEASLIKINEELCQAGLREYGN